MNSDLSFELRIIYDNKCLEEGFLPGFGFSSLIYNHFTGNYLLFDTGGNGNILIHNIQRFNIDISQIKKVIISHNHHDHMGGLEEIYKVNPKMEIYIPIGNLKAYKKSFMTTNVFGISDLFEIEQNIYSSGQLGGSFVKEQAIFLKTRKNEIIIVVGCAHPGLEQFIIKGRQIGKIIAIFGGFHGFNKFSYLNGVEIIGACHCTQYLNVIREKFPKQFQRVCVGNSFSF
ncbi:MAG: MBL fold metallo-hydrolase [Promethearchaeota archaeon]